MIDTEVLNGGERSRLASSRSNELDGRSDCGGGYAGGGGGVRDDLVEGRARGA